MSNLTYLFLSISLLSFLVSWLIKHGYFDKMIERINRKKLSPNAQENFMLNVGHYAHKNISKDYKNFDAWMQAVYGFDFNDAEYAENRYYWLIKEYYTKGFVDLLLLSPEYHTQISIQDAVALNCSYISKISQVALWKKVTSEERIWGILLLNARQLSVMFNSWEEYEAAAINCIAFLEHRKDSNGILNDKKLECQNRFHKTYAWEAIAALDANTHL